MKRPTIDEQLSAAAWRILNDGRQHHPQAVLWAREHQRHMRPRPIFRVQPYNFERPRSAGGYYTRHAA